MERPEKIRFLETNIKGVGPQKAEVILNAFPESKNIIDIASIPDAYKRLQSIVSTSLACSIIEQLKIMEKQNENVQNMVYCGIPYFSAVEIAKNEMSYNAFLENPYEIGDNYGLEFRACDKFAHMRFIEHSPDMSKSRMSYFINAMLIELEQSGHTFAYLFQLVKKLNSYQKKYIYLPNDYTEASLLLYIYNNDMFEIESKSKDIKKWKIYRKETAQLETDIAYHIRRLAANNKISNSNGFVSSEMPYDTVQLSAINSAVMSGLKVITGPPGSGKTAVINGIISYFKQLNPNARILLCAPTGRAAKHMTEITGAPSKTIHKLLGIRKETKMFMKEKLACDMLICDESSMLNLDLTYELLAHIETGTVVYFVGDKDQLPAVGPGNVLHDIINSGAVPVYQLTKVYRQDGIILENAHEINNGIIPKRTNDKYQTETFEDEILLKNKAVEIFQKLYNPKEPFETQILVPSYQSECGIIALNNEIQKLNKENFIYVSHTINGYSYKKNDKILMIKNDKNGLYQNGSVGILLANLGDELLVDFEGQEVCLPKTALNDMSLGYAISVHKSQGSEYKNVIFCLPDNPKNMLKKNILYTGVTRAKDYIKLLEMKGAIELSVNTSVEAFMQTGLKKKLQKN